MTRIPWVLASLLVLAVPATAAAAPYHVRYGGGTSQANPFVLELAPDARSAGQVSLFVDGTCVSGMVIAFDATLQLAGARVSRGGTFDVAVSTVEPFTTVTAEVAHSVTGKVRRGGRASGSYRATVVVRDATGAQVDTCDSGTVRWTARSARGRVYAGTTSQGQPMVVELDKRRSTVELMRFGWRGDCTPEGAWALGDWLTDFPIADGRFGDAFVNRYDLGDGERASLAYEVAGRQRRGRLSGTFSVRVVRTDAAGAVTLDCASGTVSWTLPGTGEVASRTPGRRSALREF